jgi:hypothetical protein
MTVMTVGSTSFFHLLVTRFCELLESVVHFIFAKDSCDALLGAVVLFAEDVPTRSLRKLVDDCEQYDRVDLHGHDGYSPGPFVFLPKVVSEDYIENERHVEAEYIGLEFLRKCHAAGVVFLRFGGVDRDNGVGTT